MTGLRIVGGIACPSNPDDIAAARLVQVAIDAGVTLGGATRDGTPLVIAPSEKARDAVYAIYAAARSDRKRIERALWEALMTGRMANDGSVMELLPR